VAILPQLFIIQRTGEAENITTHYLFALGAYRALYIPNWLYRYFADDYFDPIAVVAGLVQVCISLPVLRGEDTFSGYVVIVDCLVCRFCIYLCHEGASGSEIRVAGLRTCERGDGMLGGVRQVGGENGGAEVVATGGKQGRYSLLISMHRIDRGGNNIYLP